MKFVNNCVSFFAVFNFDFFAVFGCKFCGKSGSFAFFTKFCVNGPIFFRFEGFNFALAVNNKFYRNGLNTARGKGRTAANVFPKEGAEFITNDSVKNSAALLCVNKVGINASGSGHSLFNAEMGDFVESNAVGRIHRKTEKFCKMPGNCFAFAVRVRREINIIRSGGLFFKASNKVFLAGNKDILGNEAVFNVNSKGGFGKVANVTHGSDNGEIFAKIFFNGFCFSRGLHYNKVFCCFSGAFSNFGFCCRNNNPLYKIIL